MSVEEMAHAIAMFTSCDVCNYCPFEDCCNDNEIYDCCYDLEDSEIIQKWLESEAKE
jgi:hypothetical protein